MPIQRGGYPGILPGGGPGIAPAPGGGPGIDPGPQLDRIIKTIEKALKDLVNAANAYIQSQARTLGRIPGAGEAVMLMLGKYRDLVEQFIGQVVSILKQSHVPVLMWQAGQTWLNIGNNAAKVARSINGLKADAENGDWQGVAGAAYTNAIGPQADAAGAYQDQAKAIMAECEQAMEFGVGFYAVVAATAVAIAATAVTGIGAILSALIGLGVAVAELIAANAAAAMAFQSINEVVPAFAGQPYAGNMGGWPHATN